MWPLNAVNEAALPKDEKPLGMNGWRNKIKFCLPRVNAGALNMGIEWWRDWGYKGPRGLVDCSQWGN